MILHPDGISGPPKKKGKAPRGIPGKTPGPWRSGYVLPGDVKKGKKGGAGKVLVGTSKALVPTSSTALATSQGPGAIWPWIIGGLFVLAGAFWYTRKGKGRRPLGFA